MITKLVANRTAGIAKVKCQHEKGTCWTAIVVLTTVMFAKYQRNRSTKHVNDIHDDFDEQAPYLSTE